MRFPRAFILAVASIALFTACNDQPRAPGT